VNAGGFVASLATILLIGVVLDLRAGGGSTYNLTDFKYAMSVQFIVWAIGTVWVLRSRALVRRRLAQQGVAVPRFRDVLFRRSRTDS
jgi:hypothetical protein